MGSWISEFTAMLTSRSPLGCQVAPLSVDFQMPPATPAVHIRLFCVRWMSSARERPPMFPGPSGCQEAPSVPLVLPAAVEEVSGAEVTCEEEPPAVKCTGIDAASSAAFSSSAVMAMGSPLGERFDQ